MQDSSVTITVTAIDGATKVFQGVGDMAVKQANRAANAWIKANKVQDVSIQSTGQLAGEADRAAKAQDRLTNSTRRSYFAQTALTTVLSAGVNQAFLQMVDVTGQAIQRVDLLANFPASMAALGLSAADASVSLAKLSDYVGQIGGNLQEATTSVARFAEVTQNVKAATAVFIGLNNAIIAGGAGTQVQASALEQFIQAYSRGIPQLIEWRSLMVAMPAQLNAVAKAMNFVNAQALGEALTNGEVSMNDFVSKLTELSTGTGPIAQQALARMSGIQFAFNVFKNTLVAGMTSIIQTIGRQNIVAFFQLLTGVVAQLAVWAVKLISIFFSLFNIISRLFGGPELKLANDSTAGIADNLGGAANHAGDLADSIDDAAKAANKSLASFDKMNVLEKGKAGKEDKPSAAGTPLSAAQAAALEGIFDGMNNKIADISGSAKILAGILASIVGLKFAQGLLNQFNGLVKTLEDTSKNLDKIREKLTKGEDQSKGPIGRANESVKNLAGSLINLAAALVAAFSSTKLGAAISKFYRVALAPLALLSGIILSALSSLVVFVASFVGGSIAVAIGVIVLVVAAIIGSIYLIYKNWDTIVSGMKTIASAFADFIKNLFNSIVFVVTDVWNQLYEIFKGPFSVLYNIARGIFIAIIAILATFVEGMVLGFVLLVKLVFAVLITVAIWVYNNVVKPIVDYFVGMWDGLVAIFKFAVNIILNGVLLPISGWINGNVISPIFNLFRNLWDGIVNLTAGLFNGLLRILGPLSGWIYGNVIVPIANIFAGLWNGISNGLSGMISGFGNLLGGIANMFKAILNGVFDLMNIAIRNVNKLKIPNWVPGGLGGQSPGIKEVPHLARGGVVDQATLSVVGESGAEAIVPLENNMEWLDKLAEKISSTTGGNGQPIQLTVQIGEDQIVTKVINLINEKTQMSGRNTIYV